MFFYERFLWKIGPAFPAFPRSSEAMRPSSIFAFCSELGRAKLPGGLPLTFTHRSDEEVVNLQEKIFQQQAERREILETSELPPQEIFYLAESLPYFVNLKEFTLFFSQVEASTAAALVDGLSQLMSLTTLTFTKCSLDEAAADVLANGISECQVRLVRFAVCKLGGKAPALLQAMKGLVVMIC